MYTRDIYIDIVKKVLTYIKKVAYRSPFAGINDTQKTVVEIV